VLASCDAVSAWIPLGGGHLGHQTEGGNTDSDTWFLEHVRPSVFREPSGRACKAYELWRQDVGLVAGLGLDTYRFSVEWAGSSRRKAGSRIRLSSTTKAINGYCLGLGIAPVVTYNHFTAPHWFARRGAWLDRRRGAVRPVLRHGHRGAG